MEQRHGRIADVVGGQLEHLGHGEPIWAMRPWLHRQALGAPEVPEVNSRNPSDSVGDGRVLTGSGRAAPAAPSTSVP